MRIAPFVAYLCLISAACDVGRAGSNLATLQLDAGQGVPIVVLNDELLLEFHSLRFQRPLGTGEHKAALKADSVTLAF